MRIAIIQPLVPHYREAFFNALKKKYDIDFYVYQQKSNPNNDNFKISNIPAFPLKLWGSHQILFLYNFIPLLKQKYDLIILTAEIRSLSTWFLLLFSKLRKIRIILWGQGISIVKYIKEEKKYPYIRKLLHSLADMNWLYTEHEKKILSKYIDPNKLLSLNNTIDFFHSDSQKFYKKNNTLKKKYNIQTKINFIYCARFTNIYRRIDLLIKMIESLDKERYGFIIIGDGYLKPDFSKYTNVYDFGAVYDVKKKDKLFAMSDIYLQPAWVGLSVVEAFFYGKPILTFKRSDNIFQGVEYNYIIHNHNGYIADSLNDMINYINNLNSATLKKMQYNASNFAQEKLQMSSMVQKALNSIKEFCVR